MRNRAKSIGFGLIIASATVAGQAWAEPPAPAAAFPAAPAPAPDLVRLKNGGMLRGTIAESGGDSVTIVLLTGETRKIPAADVSYAGPAASAPSVAPAAPPAAPAVAPAPAEHTTDNGTHPFAVVHAAEARVDFVSEPTGSSLSRRSSTATFAHSGYTGPAATGYDEICTAPCNASMPAGTHTFAVAKPGGDPIEAEPITLPAGHSTLKSKYSDNTGARVGVVVAGIAALAGGLALEFDSISNSGNINSGELIGGAVLQGGGLLAILWARLIKDGVELSVSPGTAALLPNALPLNTSARATPRFLDQPNASAASMRDGFTGLHLTARF